MFAKIRLPQALPDIFTGLKVGAALSATAAVVAEFVASDRGLGYLLLQYNGNLETPMVFAVIVLLSLIGLAVYYVVEIIERITIPWHVSQQPTDRNPVLLSSSRGEVPATLDDVALDRFIARGGIALACNLALQDMVEIIEKKDGATPEAARQQALTFMVPGVILQPSGVFAALRAQDVGCKYLRAS